MNDLKYSKNYILSYACECLRLCL